MNGDEQNQNPDPQQRQYKEMPAAVKSYFKLKNALKAPNLSRDEQGLTPMRFSKHYFEDTCPYCETTAEHEGKKFKYSTITKKKLLTNFLLMLVVAVATGVGLLHMLVGIAVISVIGYNTSTHAERKMYYTLLCRKCGKTFPMDKEEQDKIREEEREKKVAAEAAKQTKEDAAEAVQTTEEI